MWQFMVAEDEVKVLLIAEEARLQLYVYIRYDVDAGIINHQASII